MKRDIPALTIEAIEKIVCRAFPPLNNTAHELHFSLLDGGIINLVYKVDIKVESPLLGVPSIVVLKVIESKKN